MMGYLDETNDLVPAEMRVRDLVQMYEEEQSEEQKQFRVKDPITFECFDRILKTLDEEEKFQRERKEKLVENMKMNADSFAKGHEGADLDALEEELRQLEMEEANLDKEIVEVDE